MTTQKALELAIAFMYLEREGIRKAFSKSDKLEQIDEAIEKLKRLGKSQYVLEITALEKIQLA